MKLSRRSALFGLLAMPAVIRTPGLLMPVKRVVMHPEVFTFSGTLSGYTTPPLLWYFSVEKALESLPVVLDGDYKIEVFRNQGCTVKRNSDALV